MNSLEGAVERRLIRESAPNGDVGKGEPRIRHQVSGPIDTAVNQPSIWRHVKCLFEGTGKVAYG